MFLFAAETGRDKFVDLDVPLWGWAALLAVIGAMLTVDLYPPSRRPRAHTE